MNLFFNTLLSTETLKIELPQVQIGQVSNISSPTLIPHAQFGGTTYWPRVYKASETPFVSPKPYIVIWSTDHDTGVGGIFWGAMDAPDFTGFTGRLGTIVSGNQAETPYLKYIPSAISGIPEEWFLYYHTDGESGNVVNQETRLITTNGGAELHLCSWTNRGRPLGVFGTDNHTGYAQVFGDGPFIANHLVTDSNAGGYSAISESTDGLTFTRKISPTNDITLSNGNKWFKNQMCVFEKSGIKLAFIIERDVITDDLYISLAKLDSNYLATEVVQRLTESQGKYTPTGNSPLRTMTHRIEGNTAYIYYSGGSNNYKNEPNYYITCDISEVVIPIDVATASGHIRGHIASFSDNTDTWDKNYYAAEMRGLKHDVGLLVFDEAASTQAKRDAYLMGKIDFGLYDSVFNPTILSEIALTREGRPVTAMSYTFNTDDNKLDYLDDFLTGRNSNKNSTAYWNLTDVDLISLASSVRYNYYTKMSRGEYLHGTLQEGLDLMQQKVNEALTDKGWYQSFMHWHWWTDDYESGLYFTKLNEFIGTADVYRGSHSDIAEYYFVRESVDSISYAGGTVNIAYSKKYPNSPYHKITTPLWIKLDLKGTSFEGKDITTSHGGKIRNAGNNIFYVSIDLNFTQASASFTISETITPSYINLNKPIVSLIGNEVTSDQPIKISLFSKPKSSGELAVTLDERQLTPSTSFTLGTVLDTGNRDYYLGFINDEKVSGVIQF